MPQSLFQLFYPTVRLVDVRHKGNLATQGLIEVLHNGVWGAVCYNGWELKDANVVCRQLGFTGALAAKAHAAFGRGNRKIWFINVQCAGDESSLMECAKSRWGTYNYCPQNKYAGVRCNTGGKKYIVFYKKNLDHCIMQF